MYCSKCGRELIEGAVACAMCGEMITGNDQESTRGSAAPVTSNVRNMTNASYEYARTSVKGDLAQVATDCYESLGFELTGSRSEGSGGASTLSFRRSRKIKGKAQLTKLQRVMDDLIASIANMEAEKTRKGTIQALAVGIIFALVLGVGMCCTMVWTNLMVPGIIIGIVGIAGCIGAYLLYRRTCAKETARINPRIESAYDSLATACEEAQAVLRAQA